MTCPSFMAAPFMWPSASTICSAASICRRSSATFFPSLVRATLVTWVPAWRTACPAASRPTRAVRPTREVGMRSLATLYLGAGDDVVGAVGPTHPGLVAAVVVLGQQDQRRLLAQRRAGLGPLRVGAPPDPH